MLSTVRVNAVLTRAMDDTFLDEIRAAGKQEDKWTERGQELARRKMTGEKMLEEWTETNGLLYYKS